jgi:photosystem II stability/assembly factor-like uncharacterized protein
MSPSRWTGILAVATTVLIGSLTPVAGAEPIDAEKALSSTEPAAWSRFGIPTHPDGREQQLMVHAPELNALIVIGGLTQHGIDDDVWVLDLANPSMGWREIVPTGSWTGPRFGASAIWDPVGRRVVIFGGDTFTRTFPGPDYRDDVWALQLDQSASSAAWVLLHGGDDTFRDVPRATAPTGRAFHAAAYDPVGHRMLVYGGLDLTTRMDQISFWFVDQLQASITGRRVLRYTLGDLWAFDLATTTWGLLSDAGIRRMYSHLAYDPVNHQLVATGGYGAPPSGENSGGWYRGETQSFDLTSSTWTTWSPQGAAPAFSNAAFAYSASTGSIVMMGLDQPTDTGLNPRGVYALRLGPGGAGAKWTELEATTFPRRPLFGMRGAIIPGPERFVVMGGDAGNRRKDWRPMTFDLASRVWSPLTPGMEPVPSGEGPRAVVDADTRSMYVVGWRQQSRPWRLDLDTGTWEPAAPIGSGPTEGVPVIDTVHRRLLVVESCTSRVWSLPLDAPGRWQDLPASGQPPPICGPVVSFDPVRQRVVVLGGHNHQGDGGPSMQNRRVFALEMPTEDAPRWEELARAEDIPFPGGTGVYDPVADRILVSSELGETLALDFTQSRDGRWLQVPTSGTSPSPWAPKVFDTANNRVVAYRYCPIGTVSVLELSGEPTWRELETLDTPAARCEPAFAYDPVGKQAFLFGGNVDSQPLNETYVLPLGGDGVAPDRPSDPAGEPPPAPSVVGGAWEPLGPEHAHPHDVDFSLGEDGGAFLATGNTSHRYGRAAGVYRSLDTGQSWSPAAGSARGRLMLEVAQSPADPNRVYASSLSRVLYEHVNGTGMYVSEDGGTTWHGSNDGLPWDDYWGLVTHPTDPDVAWASGPRGGIYRTDDGGSTWHEVTNGVLDGLWANALATTMTPHGVRLLAGMRQSDSGGLIGLGGVAYSDDGGRTWTLAFETHDQFVKALAVDSSDPARIVAAEGYGVWRSDDFGTNWEHVNGGTWEEPTGDDIHLGAVEFDPTSGGRVLWGAGLTVPCDFRDIIGGGPAAPPATPGVWRSLDGGATWKRVAGSPADEYCGLAVSPDGRTILASGVWTGLWRSTDGGQTWDGANYGVTQVEVISAAIDPASPDTIVATSRADGIYTSHDDGETWNSSLSWDEEDGREVTHVVGSGPGRFLALVSDGVYLSEDAGDTWRNTGVPGRSFFRQPSGLAVDPSDPRSWYANARTDQGAGIAVTHDDGGSYEVHPVNDGSVIASCPWNVVTDPANAGRIFVGDGCGAGIFRSDDGGITWTRISSDVGGGYIRAVAMDPEAPGRLWVGTEHLGVFRSDDGGATWEQAGRGLGLREIRSIVVIGDRVFASAMDDGVYESDDGGQTWAPVGEGSPTRSPIGLSASPNGDLLAGSLTGGVLRLHTG